MPKASVFRYRPRTVSELQQTLRHAFTSRELCVIEVPVDAGVNTVLVEKLNQYWGITS